MPTATFKIGGTDILTEDRKRTLTQLATDLESLGIESRIEYRPPTGRGVTWWEVLGIYLGTKALESATSYAFGTLAEHTVGKVISWAKSRFRSGDTRRPQSITIYGPDGKPLVTVKVSGAEQVEIEHHPSTSVPANTENSP